MSKDVTSWVLDKLSSEGRLAVTRSGENILTVRSSNEYTFEVAVLGLHNLITLRDVEPLFAGDAGPQLVINVPSKTLWSGESIHKIHSESAAFGTFGDVARAAETEDAGRYRNKNMNFFITGISQHTNVTNVSYVYDAVFRVNRRVGDDVIVAVVEAYNLSAEDVRNARTRFGQFDVLVKSTSYGSITAQAEEAANSMGAQALTFGELMRRLAQ
jgi:hypothetical protein